MLGSYLPPSGAFSAGALRKPLQYRRTAGRYSTENLLVLDLQGVLLPKDRLLAAEVCRARLPPSLVARGEELLRKYGGGAISATALIETCAPFLKGLSEEQIKAGAREIYPIEGARDFVDRVRKRGYFPVIISSDLQEAAESIAERVGIPQEFAFGNRSVYEGGVHQGRFQKPYVADEGKAKIARRLKRKMGAHTVTSIGDDSTNAALFGVSRGIAFNADAPLRAVARGQVYGGFDELLGVLV